MAILKSLKNALKKYGKMGTRKVTGIAKTFKASSLAAALEKASKANSFPEMKKFLMKNH